VVIGHENHDDALKPMSVVVAQYGATGAMTGTLAVLGPTRMEYPRAMAGVQYLSTLLGELLEGVQGSRLSG
jgi:heat-inducible transcriptional repressor